jgi:8-oxo-dGTP pyrophosphatase MutT (NUDIX family)
MRPIEIFLELPQDFNPVVSVASCYCDCSGELLFLKRAQTSLQGSKWGVPAGKLELNETPLEAVVREVYEETGIVLIPEDVSFIRTVFIRYPENDFIYHMFYQKLPEIPEVRIDTKEHQDFVWVTYEKALALPLMLAGAEVLEYCQRYIQDQGNQ